jgi:hypothetical protein
MRPVMYATFVQCASCSSASQMNVFSTPREVSVDVGLDNYISICAAAEHSGYNPQYFRRLMGRGDDEGIKIGQVWLVKIDTLDAYLKTIRKSDDRCYSPCIFLTRRPFLALL